MFTADELDLTDLHQVDPVTQRIIGHARQRHEADWLQGCSECTAVRELQFSSVQFSSSAVNTALTYTSPVRYVPATVARLAAANVRRCGRMDVYYTPVVYLMPLWRDPQPPVPLVYATARRCSCRSIAI